MKRKLLISITILLSSATIVFGQLNPKRYDYSTDEKKAIFKKNKRDFKDKIFDINEVPEKWKNESVVILAKKSWYACDVNVFTNIGYVHYFYHSRAKLQDRVAVEGFSEIYFQDDDIIEIEIEKPDGEKIEVDLSKAIDVSDNIELDKSFGSISLNISKYKKLAIANLEPGDIIDVKTFEGVRFNRNYLHWTDVFTWWFNPFIYTKILYDLGEYPNTPFQAQTLAGKYPIVKQKYEFEIGKNFYLNFRSMNDAPDIKTSKKRKRKLKRWVFEDEMRDKLKPESWSEPMFSLPSIKYAISYVRTRHKRKTIEPIDRKNKIKTKISTDDIKKIAHNFVKESRESIGDVYFKYYKEKGKKIKNNEEFVIGFYEYFKSSKLIEIAEKSENRAYNASVDNKQFVLFLVKILRKRAIPYSLIIGVPRSLGGTQSLITTKEIIWGVKLNTGRELIFTDCDFYAPAGDVNPIYEDLMLYEVKPGFVRSQYRVREIVQPASSPLNNNFSYKINAEFQPDLDTVKIKRETRLKGMSRYSYKWASFPYQKFIDNVVAHFDVEWYFVNPFMYEDYNTKKDRFFEDEDKRMRENFLQRLEKANKERAKEELEEDYQVASYDKYKVVQDGLDLEAPEIIIEDEYRLTNFIEKIDNATYVLKVGEFIESQIEVTDKDDRERQTDIVFNYPRSINYDIFIKIPSGLTISNIDHLNRKVENETGGFITTAKIDGQYLQIKVAKTYNTIIVEKTKWNELLKFIDEAVDFRNAKIILKK